MTPAKQPDRLAASETMQRELLSRLESAADLDPELKARLRASILGAGAMPAPQASSEGASPKPNPSPSPSHEEAPSSSSSSRPAPSPSASGSTFPQPGGTAKGYHEEQLWGFAEPVSEYLLEPAQLLAMAQQARETKALLQSANPGKIMSVMSFSGGFSACSRASLEELCFIELEEMEMPRIHRGYYTLLRTVTLPDLRATFTMVVASPAGAMLVLTVSAWPFQRLNSGQRPTEAEYQAQFPVGTLIAIKEPFAKLPLQGNMATLRVDSPTDLIKLSPGHSLLQNVRWRGAKGLGQPDWRPPARDCSFDAMKGDANQHFKAGRIALSEEIYTAALELHRHHPDVHLLYLNRAAARLRLSRFYPAFQDAQMATLRTRARLANPEDDAPILPFLRKAKYRRACALYGLRVWEAARAAFEELSTYEDSSDQLKRCKLRLKEATKGEYDVEDLFKQSRKKGARLDVADFVGPVQVKTLEGYGHGLFATRNIKAGELLIVNKALAIAQLNTPDAHSKSLSIGCHGSAQVELCYALLFELTSSNPVVARQIDALCSGPEDSRPLRSPEVLLSPPQTLGQLSSAAAAPVIADAELVDFVTTYNTLSNPDVKDSAFSAIATADKSKPNREVKGGAAWCGVPTGAALFNHSCWPNAEYVAFGDAIFFRASQDIKAGDQIFVSYCGNQGLAAREQDLKSSNIVCKCIRCELDRKDGASALKRREELLGDIPDAKITTSSMTPRQLEACLSRREGWAQRVAATFSLDRLKAESRPQIAPELFEVWTSLAAVAGKIALDTRSSSRALQSIRWNEQALESCGAVISKKRTSLVSLPVVFKERAGATAADIALCYEILDDKAKAESWMRTAREIETAFMGHKRLFEQRFSTCAPWKKLIETI